MRKERRFRAPGSPPGCAGPNIARAGRRHRTASRHRRRVHFRLQFAKLHGARAIITSSSDEKLARAKALGADETINYRTHPEWDKEVLRLTGGHGVDIVLEVGGGETFPRSMNCVRASGQIAVIGVLTGVAGTIPVGLIGLQTLSVHGIYVGSVAMFQDMNRAIAANQLHPVIDRVFPFEQSAGRASLYANRAAFRQNRHLALTIGDF